MSEIPDIPKQTSMWYSSSSCLHIPIYQMKDRHLLGAIGVVQRWANDQCILDEDKDSDSNWHDYTPLKIYIPLVKECVRRFLTVPGEEWIRVVELIWQDVDEEKLPCCCLCKYRDGLTCINEKSEKYNTLRPCTDPCDKFEETEKLDGRERSKKL